MLIFKSNSNTLTTNQSMIKHFNFLGSAGKRSPISELGTSPQLFLSSDPQEPLLQLCTPAKEEDLILPATCSYLCGPDQHSQVSGVQNCSQVRMLLKIQVNPTKMFSKQKCLELFQAPGLFQDSGNCVFKKFYKHILQLFCSKLCQDLALPSTFTCGLL